MKVRFCFDYPLAEEDVKKKGFRRMLKNPSKKTKMGATKDLEARD